MRMYSSGFPVNLFVASTHASGRPRAQRSQITNAVVTSPAIPPTNLIASSIVLASPGCGEVHAAPPILLRFALHRRRRRVLELEPVPCAAADIRRAQALRHDALAAEAAGVAVDDVAVVREVLDEP